MQRYIYPLYEVIRSFEELTQGSPELRVLFFLASSAKEDRWSSSIECHQPLTAHEIWESLKMLNEETLYANLISKLQASKQTSKGCIVI